MRNEFTVVYEKDEEWYIGYCLEIPGANGQGKTKEECETDLACAIALMLKDRREMVCGAFLTAQDRKPSYSPMLCRMESTPSYETCLYFLIRLFIHE